MATYNTPFKMSKRAINSVLNQDFQDFEQTSKGALPNTPQPGNQYTVKQKNANPRY